MRFFSAVLLLSVASLVVIVNYKTEPPKQQKPKDETCQAEEGWTAKIEPADGTWACVHRKGKKVHAFYY